MSINRRHWKIGLALLCGAGLVVCGREWWTNHRYQIAMEEIQTEILAGRFAIACRDLDNLLSWKSDPDGEIAYSFGSCELARGRFEAAGDAWGRVVPGSRFSEKAIEGRMELLRQTGHFSAAERLIIDAAEDPRNDRSALLVLLVPIYIELGRIDEAEQQIENRWNHLAAMGQGALEPAIKLVFRYIELGLTATPIESIRPLLEHAYKLAPDDDQVWLGRANLAIRCGDYQEAARWLDACEVRRPEDRAIRQARLNWAIATNRIDVVERGMKYVPATESKPSRSHRLNAWLAGQRGDRSTERRELELLLAADPTDEKAFGRLTEMARAEGQPALDAELVRKKDMIDRLRARYLKLYDRRQPFRDAAEAAGLAERLGRQFEARAFLTIAISEDPIREDLRRDLARLSLAPAAAARAVPRS
jgi:thioredoxin-like negative regulator of GroEL